MLTWLPMILANPLVRRYGTYAVIALLLVAAVIAWWAQTAALRSERDEAQEKVGKALEKVESANKEAAQLRSSLELALITVEAQQKAEQDRVTVQQKIEVTKNERSKRNTATLARSENKAVADIVLPDDMLDGLREP